MPGQQVDSSTTHSEIDFQAQVTSLALCNMTIFILRLPNMSSKTEKDLVTMTPETDKSASIYL